MAKAVLIMDMPESCPDCRFFESDWRECYAISKRYNRDIMTEEAKPDWCPLRELPEKMPDLEHGYENVEKSITRTGWNACLDALEQRKV
jgi:hypothetical protein